MKTTKRNPYILVACLLVISSWMNNSLGPYSGNRLPASIVKALDFNSYREFFIPELKQNNIRFEVKKEFETNKDSEYLKKNLKRLIADVLHESAADLNSQSENVTIDDEQSPLTAVLKSSLVDEILGSLKKNPLKVLKYINGEFLFKFHIVPVLNTQDDWSYETSTNQFVEWKLNKSYRQEEFSLKQSLLSSPVDHNERLNYLGGTILVKLELLDLDLSKNILPETKRKAIKGSIVLRKYFSHQKHLLHDATFEDQLDKLTHIDIRLKKNKDIDIITIDQKKYFDLGDFVPKKAETIIHFGQILESKVGDNIPFIDFKSREKSHTVSKWNLKISSTNGQREFLLNSLVFDHKSNSFNTKQSELDFKKKHAGPRHTDRSETIKNKRIKDLFINKFAAKLVNDIGLSKYLD